jgi:hypothetical protein
MSTVGAPPIHEPASTPASERSAARAAAVELLLDDAAQAAGAQGREDLVTRLEEVRHRVARTETVICVVGEFKQGKSALINGLLGEAVCPVDDDLATVAVTVVRYGEQRAATVRRRDGDTLVVEAIPPEQLDRWVTERANPDNRRNVDLVEVSLPNPFLQGGVSLIDTPGVGGLNAAHAAATLAFLPLADALVFVTDASAELSGPELEFLAAAWRVGRPIIVGFTKTDMYPDWRRILDINEGRLDAFDGALRSYPLSAVLRADAENSDDESLAAESGYPSFARDLQGQVAERARATAADAAIAELRSASGQLRQPLATELQALERPNEARELAERLVTIRDRLRGLDEASATWSVRLDDEFAALRGRVGFEFHGRMRGVARQAHEEIEALDPGRSWTELSERTQQRVATAVREAFVDTTDGVQQIRATVAGLLADEQVGRLGASALDLDVADMWRDGQAFGGGVRSGLVAGFALLAGATVGIEVLGMLGALLGTALVGPALLGATLFFGGKEVIEERRRRLADRRQEARSFVTQFVDNVQFEVDGRLDGLLAELQRQLRSQFGARIQELMRTTRDTEAAIRETIERTDAQRSRRSTELRAALDEIEAIEARVDGLEGAAHTGQGVPEGPRLA